MHAQAFGIILTAIAVVCLVGRFKINRRHGTLVSLVTFQFVQVVFPVKTQFLLAQHRLQTVSANVIIKAIIVWRKFVALFKITTAASIRAKSERVASFRRREKKVVCAHFPIGRADHREFILEAIFVIFQQTKGAFYRFSCGIHENFFKFFEKNLFDSPTLAGEGDAHQVILQGLKLLFTGRCGRKRTKFGR